MKSRSVVLVSILVVACSPKPTLASSEPAASPGPTPLAEASTSPIVRTALASREAHRFAASLANDVGPRLAGSAGDAAALKWAERTMRDLKLANVHLEPVVVPVWRRGEDRAAIVSRSGDSKSLDVSALGWSGSTKPDGTEAEVVRVASIDELAKLPDSAVRGKIVFIDARMERASDGSGYGKAVSARYQGQAVSGTKGAAATLIRSVGTDETHPHTGSTNRGDAPGIPIGALSNASADVLARELASGPTRVRLVLTSERLPDAHSANVVGEIVGRESPDEVVLLGAHLDSWDTGRGAVDDAAGCGVVLDAMRVLASTTPSRTVRAVLFAAEENSRAGGTRYAEAHANELGKIVLALEVDGGTDRFVSMRFLGDAAKRPMVRAIAEPLAPLGVPFLDERGYAGADISPLVSAGVPVIDLPQDASRYFDIHHTPGDTADKLDPEALAQMTAAVAHVAWRASDPSLAFGRVPAAMRNH